MGAMPVAQPPTWATLVLAPNPGPMTLDGTNSWVLRAPGAPGSVVVDPGPADPSHLAALAEAGPIEAVLITHGHPDHVESLDEFATLFARGAPVGAGSERWCRGMAPLRDGDRLDLAGLSITVLATPGHTSDSLCLLVEHEGGDRAVLTGDTILGRGTTVVAWPDGDLGAYLTSLRRLSAYPGVPVLPGHGPVLADCGAIATAYHAHREDRLTQVRSALADGARTPAEVVAAVYPGLDTMLVPAAEWTVRAALAYLDPP